MANGGPRNYHLLVAYSAHEEELLRTLQARFGPGLSMAEIVRTAVRVFAGEAPPWLYVRYTLHGPEYALKRSAKEGRRAVALNGEPISTDIESTTPHA